MTSRRHTTVIAGRLAALGALPVAVTVAMLAAGTAQAEPIHSLEQSPVQPGVTSDPAADAAPDPGLIQAAQPAVEAPESAPAPAPAPATDPQPAAPAPADNSVLGQVTTMLAGDSAAVGSAALGAFLLSHVSTVMPGMPATISATGSYSNPYTLFGVPLS